jgi:hypothetical protein
LDGFALHKGHCYATVIMDADRKRMLWDALKDIGYVPSV